MGLPPEPRARPLGGPAQRLDIPASSCLLGKNGGDMRTPHLYPAPGPASLEERVEARALEEEFLQGGGVGGTGHLVCEAVGLADCVQAESAAILRCVPFARVGDDCGNLDGLGEGD